MVPLAGIEPARLAALDFESSASTNSTTGASRRFDGRSNKACFITNKNPEIKGIIKTWEKDESI